METVDLTDSRQTEVLVVAWVMTGLAILTVFVKLFTRIKIVQVVGWDDFFIFLSLVRTCLVHFGRNVFGLDLTCRRFLASSHLHSCTMV